MFYLASCFVVKKLMPIHIGRDVKGIFYQFGSHGKKYHIDQEKPILEGLAEAYAKAMRQGQAMHAHNFASSAINTRMKNKKHGSEKRTA